MEEKALRKAGLKAMHDLALEPWSILTMEVKGGDAERTVHLKMDLGSSRLEQAPLNNAAGLWTKVKFEPLALDYYKPN